MVKINALKNYTLGWGGGSFTVAAHLPITLNEGSCLKFKYRLPN